MEGGVNLGMNGRIETLRKGIDGIDAQIVAMLSRRLEAAMLIGREKRIDGIPLRDVERENEVLESAGKSAARQGAISSGAVEGIFGNLIEESARAQEKSCIAVAFQGERGAFSEQAARATFKNCVPLAFRTFTEAFAAVENGDADVALLPVENSTEGPVGEVHDLLAQKNLAAIGEALLRVKHCLVAMPGTELNWITEVYSHPQALGQCSGFLKKELPHARTVPFYDTAGAARMIAAQEMEGAAAIASEGSAVAYGLEILRKGIEDSESNTTRFLALRKGTGKTQMEMGTALKTTDGKEAPQKTEDRLKTSIIFSASHTPSSLSHALEPFAKRSLNLTRIESRPSRRTPWEYVFFLDFEGTSQEGAGREAIEEMKRICRWLNVLGTYPKSRTVIGE